MQQIRDDMLCAAAAFGKTAADMVYGEGPMGARIMLVGEAPGAEETRLLRPFVGKAGKNLDEFPVCAEAGTQRNLYHQRRQIPARTR